MVNIQKTVVLAACLGMMSIGTSCLKTRAQLKEDKEQTEPSAPGQPVPAQVQEVQPKDGYIIDEIKSEITRMTGRIEDLERSNQQNNSPEKQDEIKKLEGRIMELEKNQAALLETIKKLESAPPPPISPVDAKQLLEKGKKQSQAGDYDSAIESFSLYLKTPGVKSVSEALFLRGEAHYDLKQYKKAIIDFSDVRQKHSKSKLVPAAIFKIALSFEALGMKNDAKDFYQEIIDRFPNSPEAKKAKAKLK